MVGHNAEKGTYGDCLRACIASILELNSDEVPHFYYDGCDGETGSERITAFLLTLGLAPVYAPYDGDETYDDVMENAAHMTNGAHYILWGNTGDTGGDHAVVCQYDKVVHNPSWGGNPIIAPTQAGIWSIMVLARI